MKRFYNIVFVLLSLLLGSMGSGFSTPVSSDTSAELRPVSDNGAQSTQPLNRPGLFNIYHQAEQVADSSNIMPSPPSVTEEEDKASHYQNVLGNQRLQVRVRMESYTILDRTFASLKLIFPFHSFL